MAQVAQKVENGELILVVSTMVEVEVFEGKINADHRARFTAFLNNRNIERVAVDARIAERARKIREACAREFGKPTSGPDAVHLATALSRRVLEFQTLEGKKNKTHSIGLGKLDGHRIVDLMPIKKPRLPTSGAADLFHDK